MHIEMVMLRMSFMFLISIKRNFIPVSCKNFGSNKIKVKINLE